MRRDELSSSSSGMRDMPTEAKVYGESYGYYTYSVSDR